MRLVSNPLACGALCVLLGASQQIFAQTGDPPPRHLGDPAAVALNNLLEAAQAAVDKKDYANAAQSYEDYLTKRPDDAIVHYDLGYAYSALKRTADAKSQYERAIALDPKMVSAYLNLGVTLLETDPAAAVEPLQKAADLAPQDARPKWLLGNALEGRGQLAPAIEQYQAARKLDDANFKIRLSLGHALLSAGRASEAEIEYRAALTLHATDSEVAQVQLSLARVLIAEKKFPEASGELDFYLRSQPNDAKTRMERATLLIDLGKYDDALAELDRAAAAGPEDLRSLELRSDIYWQQKRYLDAVPILQRAAALAPNDAEIPARLGRAYLQGKDYADAVHWLAAAYNMNPRATDVLAYLVDAQYGGKNYGATLKTLDELEKRQELPAASWYLRGSCYDNLGQLAQALSAYQKFLQMNKDENSDLYFAAAARVRELSREVQNKKR
jgi:tetratricopeptide (TPR) repeat protein